MLQHGKTSKIVCWATEARRKWIPTMWSIYMKFYSRQTNLWWNKTHTRLPLGWRSEKGLIAKLHKGSFLGDKNVLCLIEGGHRVCAIVTTHQILHLKCVHFTVCKIFLHLQRKKKKPLETKVCVKLQWSWTQLFLITRVFHDLICDYLYYFD